MLQSKFAATLALCSKAKENVGKPKSERKPTKIDHFDDRDVFYCERALQLT